ncbi:MAG: TetR/AcrR family transcriptional regulator [Myxococcota bacterium]
MARTIPPKRLQELADCALEVFIQQGYRRTQMGDVASKLGVAKGTLYLYVESKKALFALAVRRASHGDEPILLPEHLPLPTPKPGAILATIAEELKQRTLTPRLTHALNHTRAKDPERECIAILGELFDLLAANRIGIKLADRCALDFPDMATLFYTQGRIRLIAQLARYLEQRIQAGQLRPQPDIAVAARVVLETLTSWAVHIHWDPYPQPVDGPTARTTVLTLLTHGLLVRERRA